MQINQNRVWWALCIISKSSAFFIPYADLTKEDVVGWLEAGLDVDSMKKNIDKQIELKIHPVNETLRPDWN